MVDSDLFENRAERICGGYRPQASILSHYTTLTSEEVTPE